MAATITKRPLLELIPGVKSRYTSSEHPIYYTFFFNNIDFITYPSYKLKIFIYEFGSDTLLGVKFFRPLGIGSYSVDIQKMLKPYLEYSYNPDFSAGINSAEPKTVLRYYIKYQEILEEGVIEYPVVSDESNYINVVLATKQIGQLYGQNVGEFACLNTPNNELAKFMTEFETPVMWRGWPFEISFLFTSELNQIELKRNQTLKDVNGTFISSNQTTLDPSQINNINYLNIDSNQNVLAKQIDVQIKTGLVSLSSYVYEGYVIDGYTEDL